MSTQDMLYDWAQQAGVAPPSEDPTPALPGYTQGLMGGSLAAPEDPLSTQETPQDAMGARQVDKVSQSTSSSSSVSGKRLNGGTLSTLDARGKSLDQKIDADMSGVDKEFAPVTSSINDANDEGKKAEQAVTDATVARTEQEARNAQFMSNLNLGINHRIQRIHDNTEGDINKAKTRYMESQAQWAAMKVDPSAFWGGLNGGQKFGMLMTAFVHDFLGAKGIKTSGMDSINSAIERNIQSQIHNIQHGGEVTQGFRQLYDMEVKDAQSQYELMDRLKPYFLEAGKQLTLSKVLPYESQLATAQGQKGIAELDKAKAKSLADVFEHISTTKTARRNQDIQYEIEKGKTAAENWRTSIAAKEQNLRQKEYDDRQKAAKAVAAKDARDETLIDPEDNVGKWRITSKDEGTRSKVKDAIGGIHDVNGAINKLRELARKYEGGEFRDEAGVTRFSDEDRRMYNELQLQLAHGAAKANGERATKEDVQEFKAAFPLETGLTNGGVQKILAYTQQRGVSHGQTLIKMNTEDLPKDQWVRGAQNVLMPTTTEETKQTLAEAERGGPQKTHTDLALEGLKMKDAAKPAADETFTKQGFNKDSYKMEWDDFAAKHDEAQKHEGYGDKRDTTRDRLRQSAAEARQTGNWARASELEKQIKTENIPKDVPAYAVHISALADDAKQGKKQALEKLIKLATTAPWDRDYEEQEGVTNLDDKQTEYYWAQYELHKLPHGDEIYKATERVREHERNKR